MDRALGRTIDTIQGRFDLTTGLAEYSLAASALLQVLALAIALLAFRGLKPRIDEYRA